MFRCAKLPDLSPLHEQIGEVDDGELAEGSEAGDEAEDDVHVEGRGVAHRRPADQADRLNHSTYSDALINPNE